MNWFNFSNMVGKLSITAKEGRWFKCHGEDVYDSKGKAENTDMAALLKYSPNAFGWLRRPRHELSVVLKSILHDMNTGTLQGDTSGFPK